MSSILQRLAGQAMGTQASGAMRVRPAMSVHAQVPVSLQSDGESSPLIPAVLPKTTSQSQSYHNVSADKAELAKESVTVVHSVETIRGPATVPIPQRTITARVDSETASRDESSRRDPHDFAGNTPRPLLDEVAALSQAPIIKPASQPSTLASAPTGRSRDEPTEVHVHIGRIEVISAPEPVPPKKNRAASARATLPLADYLARRRRS